VNQLADPQKALQRLMLLCGRTLRHAFSDIATGNDDGFGARIGAMSEFLENLASVSTYSPSSSQWTPATRLSGVGWRLVSQKFCTKYARRSSSDIADRTASTDCFMRNRFQLSPTRGGAKAPVPGWSCAS
jgi:type II secretory pathway component PulJ